MVVADEKLVGLGLDWIENSLRHLTFSRVLWEAQRDHITVIVSGQGVSIFTQCTSLNYLSECDFSCEYEIRSRTIVRGDDEH